MSRSPVQINVVALRTDASRIRRCGRRKVRSRLTTPTKLEIGLDGWPVERKATKRRDG
jgi:hypothetical protein